MKATSLLVCQCLGSALAISLHPVKDSGLSPHMRFAEAETTTSWWDSPCNKVTSCVECIEKSGGVWKRFFKDRVYTGCYWNDVDDSCHMVEDGTKFPVRFTRRGGNCPGAVSPHIQEHGLELSRSAGEGQIERRNADGPDPLDALPADEVNRDRPVPRNALPAYEVFELTNRDYAELKEAKKGCTQNGCMDKAENGVNEDYCKYSVEDADRLFVKKQGSDVTGVTTVKMHGHIPYIAVICSQGGGGVKMLEAVDALAKAEADTNPPQVKLHALSHVISYYLNFGYEPKDCECPCQMSSEMRTALEADVKSPFGLSMVKQQMINEGLTADKRCGLIRECDNDGYTMTKCINV